MAWTQPESHVWRLFNFLPVLQGPRSLPVTPFWWNYQHPESLLISTHSFLFYPHLWNQLPHLLQSHSSLQGFNTALHHHIGSSRIHNHDLFNPPLTLPKPNYFQVSRFTSTSVIESLQLYSSCSPSCCRSSPRSLFSLSIYFGPQTCCCTSPILCLLLFSFCYALIRSAF